MIFLPFLCRLRFLEIYLDFTSGDRLDFDIIFFLMGSLSISLRSPEHLEFNIRIHGSRYNKLESNTFYENLRTAWNDLDSITTHPASSRLQRINININYVIYLEHESLNDDEAEHVKEGILKAVFCGLPLLHKKGILFVEAVMVWKGCRARIPELF